MQVLPLGMFISFWKTYSPCSKEALKSSEHQEFCKSQKCVISVCKFAPNKASKLNTHQNNNIRYKSPSWEKGYENKIVKIKITLADNKIIPCIAHKLWLQSLNAQCKSYKTIVLNGEDGIEWPDSRRVDCVLCMHQFSCTFCTLYAVGQSWSVIQDHMHLMKWLWKPIYAVLLCK